MALGRPVNKDTQYKVIVHTLGKTDTLQPKSSRLERTGRSSILTSIGERLRMVIASTPERTTSMLLWLSATNSSFHPTGT